MKRAFHIIAFMLPLSVVSASFAPKAHPSASFYANGPMLTSSGYQCPAVWEPSALISSLGHTDEEEPSIFFNGSTSFFPVPDMTATLPPSAFSPQSGDDVVSPIIRVSDMDAPIEKWIKQIEDTIRGNYNMRKNR
ncbi:MAG: hypothetical protein IJ202_11820 [Bacteroidales bacterium]|nr:hypothetical protein [Bacteroidales bacterium]MBQ9712625.1 hypothetical protein [Bacteroidales bacterium]